MPTQKLENYNDAINSLEEAVKLEPVHADAWTNLGNAYFASENYEKAISCYKKSLQIDSDNELALGNTLRVLIHLISIKKVEEALERLGETLAELPIAFRLWNDVGVAIAKSKEYEKAIRCFEEAVKLKPDFIKAWFNKGLIYAELNDNKNVIESYEKVLDINSSDIDAWNNMGNAYYKLGKIEKSIECYDQALKINNRFADTMANKAHSLSDLGKFESAIKLCNEALEIDPSNKTSWLVLGEIYFSLENYERALENLQKARELDPKNIAVNSFMGLAYFHLDDFQRTIKFFEEIKEIEARPHILKFLGSAYLKTGQYEKAISNLEMAKQLEPSVDIQTILGNAYLTMGAQQIENRNYKKAIEYFEKATTNIPKDLKALSLDAMNLEAIAFLNLKSYERAVELLETVVDLEPENKSAWHNLAVSNYKLMRYEKAIDCFRRELELDPRNFDSWLSLGMIYLNGLLEFENAMATFSKALAIKPYDPTASLKLAESYICMGESQQAHELALEVSKSSDDAENKSFALFFVMCSLIFMGKRSETRRCLNEFIMTYQEYPKKIRIEKIELNGISKVISDAEIATFEKDFLRSIINLLRNRLNRETFINVMSFL